MEPYINEEADEPLGDEASPEHSLLIPADHKFERSVVEYLFTGKLTLFPLTILFLGVGAGVLLLQGNKPYLDGYFDSKYMWYGVTGLVLAFLAVGFFLALALCIVLKISFTLNSQYLVIKKHGVFRSSQLEFKLEKTSLHYFRTHFSNDQAWLQLVVKEDNQFYQIFSWKGKGNQKDRFLQLFVTLQRELIKWQVLAYPMLFHNEQEPETGTEIVSRKEVNLINPFTQRLKNIVNSEKMMKAKTTCIEDIPVINYDKFFGHFFSKKIVHK